MSEFLLKTIIACVLLALGVAAFLDMMIGQGRPNPQAGPERYSRLRRAHRVFGYAFAALLIPQIVLGLDFLDALGDNVALRGVLHYLVAELMIAMVVFKILIARSYRGMLKFSPGLGLGVTALLFATFINTAGYYLLRLATDRPVPSESAEGAAESGRGRGAPPGRAAGEGVRESPAMVEAGQRLFAANCARCHQVDHRGGAVGPPGLQGLFKHDKLPATGRPANDTNVVSQIRDPVGPMPAFRNLNDQELADLLAYLHTL